MSHQTIMAMFTVVQIAFAFAFGACVGSLINVLVYRMPRGLNVVTPASRCPSCGHGLTWRENIPVLGWVLLRGRCRFCRTPISPEYPIIEAFVGLTFVAFFVLWYVVPDRGAVWLGFDWSMVKPEWAANGFAQTWPVFVTLLVLISALIAMTIIDARTFTIPLALAWTPTVLAVIAHPLWALYVQARGKPWRHLAEGEWWALATPGPFGWHALCAAFGALLGLGIANALLALGLIRRSFEDYDQWEARALAEAGIEPEPAPAGPTPTDAPSDEPAPEDAPAEAQPPARRGVPWTRALTVGVFSLLGAALGGVVAGPLGAPVALGGLAGLFVAVVAVGPLVRWLREREAGAESSPDEGGADTPAELWIQYPHARREVLRELLFLAPCIALALVGWTVGQRLGAPWSVEPTTMELIPSRAIPLWASVLGGVALGYLVGGGLVWGIRIFGTLGFGKEAMGLGDVHLLAAVGACLGWIDAALAFFVAPFIALGMVLVQAAWTGGGRKAMPYGPYLAVATVVVVLAKPAFEAMMGAIFGSPTPLDFP